LVSKYINGTTAHFLKFFLKFSQTGGNGSGIGPILATVIFLETGGIERFADVGDYESSCRCVGSVHVSNGKKKGEGNAKKGNRYLAWTYIEAVNFAIRHCELALNLISARRPGGMALLRSR